MTHEIQIDLLELKDELGLINRILQDVGAPVWHGKNINALVDSLVYGNINRIDSDLRLVIYNKTLASKSLVDLVINLQSALQLVLCDVNPNHIRPKNTVHIEFLDK